MSCIAIQLHTLMANTDNDFAKYLKARNKTHAQFAREFGASLGIALHRRSVGDWVRGVYMPSLDRRILIEQYTQGAVTRWSWCASYPDMPSDYPGEAPSQPKTIARCGDILVSISDNGLYLRAKGPDCIMIRKGARGAQKLACRLAIASGRVCGHAAANR